jgi:rhodanese-related sulfurtransferase
MVPISLKQHRFIFVAVLLALLIIALPIYWPGSVLNVTPESVMTMIEKGQPPTILDVRTGREFESGHLPYAISASFPSLFFEHKDLAVSRVENVIVYCGTGFRARLASLFLKTVGFKSIYLLDGQLNGWKANGYPLVVPSKSA